MVFESVVGNHVYRGVRNREGYFWQECMQEWGRRNSDILFFLNSKVVCQMMAGGGGSL